MKNESLTENTLTTTGCEYCHLVTSARSGESANFIAELHTGLLLLHPNQSQRGRLRLVLKEHETRLLSVPKDVRQILWQDLDLIVSVMREALQPLKVNLLGPCDGEAHAHEVWEFVPRYADDPGNAQPVWNLVTPSADLSEGANPADVSGLRRVLLRGFLTVAPVRREIPAPSKVRRRY